MSKLGLYYACIQYKISSKSLFTKHVALFASLKQCELSIGNCFLKQIDRLLIFLWSGKGSIRVPVYHYPILQHDHENLLPNQGWVVAIICSGELHG